jgi:AcrR family transcriptional regulator
MNVARRGLRRWHETYRSGVGPGAQLRIATSKRGLATRRLLMDAGRRVFERDGFLDAKITEIVSEAGVAVGSFYTHFPTKDDLLAAIIDETTAIMLYPTMGADSVRDDPIATIERANRAYLAAYEEHAALMRVFEEVAAISDRFRAMREERSHAFYRRNARAIRRLQDRGVADPDLDPEAAAIVLSTMVSRVAYGVFALGTVDIAPELLIQTVTRLWVNALGIHGT